MATESETDLTPKQELFAHLYVETGNAAEAYRTAYQTDPNARDAWIYVEASRLIDYPKITLRIEALRAAALKRHAFTLTQASEQLEAARQMAMQEGQAGAAVSAITSRAKLFGLDKPQRIDLTSSDGSMSSAEGSAVDVIAERLARIAAANGEEEGLGEPDGGAG
ncbi:terminase small subunit [Aestuariibius sp. 2305UL40-4]|uniref:terminase small subunit n=1 Tax=Aestuariibius violaceus TaxID=3234132 RepID=UPI00345E1EDA